MSQVNKKIKILFVIPSLKAGGAERVVSFIAQKINPQKFHSIMLVVGKRGDDFFLNDTIEVIYLNKSRFLYAMVSLFRKVLDLKPDIVLSSIGHINLYFGFLRIILKRKKFIARESSIPSLVHKLLNNKTHPFIKSFFLSKLDKIIFQSRDMENDFKTFYSLPKIKGIIINNPITNTGSNSILNENKTVRNHFITVGSLTAVKGHARILNILRLLEVDFYYTIIGDGVLKQNLWEQVKSLNLEAKVEFLGEQRDLTPYYKNNSIYLQGSYFEGFPNSVLEALSIGIPVIAFNSPGGHNEMIKNKFNGFLCSSEKDYFKKISKAMEQKWDRELIKTRTYENYNSNKILNLYEELFISEYNKI